MAEAEAPAARLAALVRLVADELAAEVCSIYVMRPGEILELVATEGLRQDAVHRTRLRVGEGIVGTVAAEARPLNLPDAQNHPAFAYRPETGEEPFASMLAVPLLRAGRVLGVLAVQTREARLYTEPEVEALETVAMLLAELVLGLRPPPRDRDEVPRALAGTLPRVFEGVGLTPGIALGPAVRHGARPPLAAVLATDPAAERERLEAAVAAMHAGLDTLLAGSAGLVSGSAETREVFEAYRLIAADAGWLARIRDAVAAGLTAEAAVERELAELRARMRRVRDAYLRERLADLEDAAGGSSTISPAARAPRACLRASSCSRDVSAPRSCSTITAAGLRACCSRREAPPRTRPSSPARSRCRCLRAAAARSIAPRRARRCCSTPRRGG
jgi:phosphotransferase system enzyme I (PtsP)